MVNEYSVKIAPDGGAVAVGMIYCVGRNYALHAKEMGSEIPNEPVIFTKPKTALVATGSTIKLPAYSNEIHFETELVYLIGSRLNQASETEAARAIAAVGVGLDLTMRDRQAAAKREGKPWAVAKGFDGSAPVGGLVPIESLPGSDPLKFTLEINGAVRQRGDASAMLFTPAYILSWLSSIFTLLPGDLLFSGTPEGVGQIVSGDTLLARIDSQDATSLAIEIA